MSNQDHYAHVAHPLLLLSLLMPDAWTVTDVADHQIRLFGPEHPELDDYRPTLSISMHQPDGFGDEWFDRFCADSVERLRDSHEGFSLRSIDRFPLSSLVEVHATWYEWQAAPDHRSSQLQAFIAVDAYRCYLINAAAKVQIADRYLPIFDRIVRSIRILPTRP